MEFYQYKKPHSPYFIRFLNQFKSFSTQNNLIPKGSNIWISLSAGVDSMALLVIFEILKGELEINLKGLIHINHQTRDECEKEQKHIEIIAKRIGVELKLFHFNEDVESNIEKRYRDFRKKCYLKIHREDLILQGHHLDDCFEWSMMQKLKQSSLKSQLGIPVKNNNIVRPLMCFSKDQLYRFANVINLKFFEDSSNQSLNYERNYIRNLINSSIKIKYPSYLKNYVSSQRELLRLIRKTSYSNEVIHNERSTFILNFKDGLVLDELSEQVSFEIKRFSEKTRGKIREQIEKLKIAIKNKKGGPLLFSGGVSIYVLRNTLMITNSHLFIVSDSIDLEINYYQYAKQLKKYLKLTKASPLVSVKKWKKGMPKSVPSWADRSQMEDQGSICALAFLSWWQRQNARHQKLEITLLF